LPSAFEAPGDETLFAQQTDIMGKPKSNNYTVRLGPVLFCKQ